MKVKILDVKGMMCDHCRMHVEKALNGIEGVSAQVDLKNNSARVSLSKEVADDALIHAVEEAGYQVTSVREQA